MTPGRDDLPAGARVALVSVAFVLLAPPAVLSAQGAGGDASPTLERDLELVGEVGVLTPLALLSSDPGTFATEVSSSVAASGTLTYWFGRAWGLAAHGVLAPARLNVRQSGFTGPIPDDLGDADYRAATVNLVFRLGLPGPASLVEPYLALGGGIRELTFDPIAQLDVQDTTDPVVTVAGGAYVRLGRSFIVRLQLRDYLSRFDATATGESTLQNDIVVSVGLGVRP